MRAGDGEETPLEWAHQQTLIFALSACILVFTWDGRPVPTRYHTLAKIPHASVLTFLPFIVFFTPLCHYIIVSFGVALLPILIITCFRVTAQEEMDMAQEEHRDKGRHAIPHIPHRARDLSSLGVVCLRLDVTGV